MSKKNSLIQTAVAMHEDGDNEGIKKSWLKTGAIQYARFKRAEQTAELALMLRSVKDGKEYLTLGYKTFTEYCELELGMSDSQCYEILKQLDALGDSPYQALLRIGLSFRDLKSLREGKATQKVETTPEGDSIKIAGKEVALVPENKDEIMSLVKGLKDDLKAAKQDAKAEAKRRVEAEEKLKEAEEPKVIEVKSLEKFKLDAEALEQEFGSLIYRISELTKSVNTKEQQSLMMGMISKLNTQFGFTFEGYFYE